MLKYLFKVWARLIWNILTGEMLFGMLSLRLATIYHSIFTTGRRSVRFSWGLPWLCFSLSLTLNPIQKYNFCEFSEKIKDQRARALPWSFPVRAGWLITDQRLLQLPFLNEKLRALKNWIKYAVLRRISTGTSTIGGSSGLLNISVCAG